MNNNQSGAALIVSLIILIIITLIGIYGMRTSTIEYRMSANYQDRAIATKSAQMALHNAENFLDSTNYLELLPSININGRPEVWYPTAIPADNPNTWWQSKDANWWQSHAMISTQKANQATLAPQYIIEPLDSVIDPNGNHTQGSKKTYIYYYRITARGTGKSNRTQVLLQSVYAKRVLR